MLDQRRDAHPGEAAEDCEAVEAAVATALVGRIRRGDRVAEQAFVVRYRRGLVLLLRRWTGDLALAEDVAQDTLLIAIERLREEGLEDPTKLLAFLRRTAQNLVVAGGRKAARRRTDAAGDELPDTPDLGPDHFERMVSEEHAARVRAVIARLPVPRDRELLTRYYLADQDKDELCAALGLEELHFNRVLHRARQRFRDLWIELVGRPRRDKSASRDSTGA
jgi:RNA polymerase sigma-70 factor (ECF subfamily)